MKIRCTNIKWDTDGEDISLPETLVLSDVKTHNGDLEETITDRLSDNYGWLVSSLEYEVV